MDISFKYYKHNPAIIQLALLLYIRYPLSLRQVEDMLFERGIAREADVHVKFAMRQFVSGGIDLAPRMRPRSERSARLILSNIQNGGGI